MESWVKGEYNDKNWIKEGAGKYGNSRVDGKN
jgi:hypothetical protein